eukprot:185472_1
MVLQVRLKPGQTPDQILSNLRKAMADNRLALDMKFKWNKVRRYEIPQNKAARKKREIEVRQRTDIAQKASDFALWRERLAELNAPQVEGACAVCGEHMERGNDARFLDKRGWSHQNCWEEQTYLTRISKEQATLLDEARARSEALKSKLAARKERRVALRKDELRWVPPTHAQRAGSATVVDGREKLSAGSPIPDVIAALNAWAGWPVVPPQVVPLMLTAGRGTLAGLWRLQSAEWDQLPLNALQKRVAREFIGNGMDYSNELTQAHVHGQRLTRISDTQCRIPGMPVSSGELMASVRLRPIVQRALDRESVYSFETNFAEKTDPTRSAPAETPLRRRPEVEIDDSPGSSFLEDLMDVPEPDLDLYPVL